MIRERFELPAVGCLLNKITHSVIEKKCFFLESNALPTELTDPRRETLLFKSRPLFYFYG